MFFYLLALLTIPGVTRGNYFTSPLLNVLRRRLCDSVQLEGLISDCSCDFGSVDKSVTQFFLPILKDVTSRTFFRYFRVNLDGKCPFWQEDGQCMMESCSVCTCEDNEVPRSWVDDHDRRNVGYGMSDNSFRSSDGFGWISSAPSAAGTTSTNLDDNFGQLNMSVSFRRATDSYVNGEPYLQYLRDTEDDDNDWTDMSEGSVNSKSKLYPITYAKKTPYEILSGKNSPPPDRFSKGAYVNLLQNPEEYTGYSGPSAARVWQSIQQENCFGGVDDICVEKRVFYRLMSGLQASISTHIAQRYFYPDGRWDTNIPLFVKAVGSHQDRLSNLYFTFLFVLRAVTKAGSVLTEYPFHTGVKADDDAVRALIKRLVKSRPPSMFSEFKSMSKVASGINCADDTSSRVGRKNVLEQCRNGFDESVLFQVPPQWLHGDLQYTQGVLDKQHLKEEFKNRFRNITRIMDCVTCEKCKVWGKLQILGLGTAIKILMTPEKQLRQSAGFLNRQEVIALLNTLHQLTKSVSFAAHAADLELSSKISSCWRLVASTACFALVVLFIMSYRRGKWCRLHLLHNSSVR